MEKVDKAAGSQNGDVTGGIQMKETWEGMKVPHLTSLSGSVSLSHSGKETGLRIERI